MSDEGKMLLNMSLTAAKRLRRRYGDEKYGPFLRNTSFVGQAYIEAVDIDNYLDIAEEIGELRSDALLRVRHAATLLIAELQHAHKNTKPS